jgi:hypothetical protein
MRSSLGPGFFYAIASVPLMLAGVVGPDVFHLSDQLKELTFFACMALAFLCVLLGAWKEIQEEKTEVRSKGHRRRMIAIWGMALCGLGFIGFTCAYFWPLLPTGRLPLSGDPQDSREPARSPSERVAIYVECESVFSPLFPASGKIYALPAGGFPNITRIPGGIATLTGSPGTKIAGNMISFANKCDVYNYSNSPLINVELGFPMRFREAVKNADGNGQTTGRTLLEGVWKAILPKIEPGVGNPFTLYLFHIGPQFIEMYIPEIANYHILGDSSERTVAIDKPQGYGPIFLDPGSQPTP